MVAANPSGDDVFGPGDTLTLTFDADTDTGGLGVGSSLDKASVDALVSPSQALGADYSAVWSSSAQLVITVVNATGVEPPSLSVGGSQGLNFTIQVRMETGVGWRWPFLRLDWGSGPNCS